MTIMSVFSVWLTWGLMAAPDMPRVLWLISTYQMPLRNVQVHGMALALLLALTGGMSWRADRPTGFRRRVTLGCLTIGLLMEVTLFIAFRWTGQLMFAASLLPAWILILVGVIVSSKRDKRRRPANSFHGEYRFTRAAFQWLILSLLMLMAMPLYQALTGIAFSHAYYGAIQHAALVGFTTQAAMGWIQTATQHDKPSKSHHLFVRWGPFVLLNLGCAMRLYIQVLTDFHPAAFGLLPVTGLIEWLAMVWWAVPVLRKLIHTPQLTGRVPDAGGQVVLPKVPRQSARSGLTKLGHSLR